MGFARVVSFDGVSTDQMEKRAREIEERERPEGLPATEIIALHNPEDETALAILFFETEDDYTLGDATLNAMPAEDTPGRRGSVTKYNVALRMTV
jgi:hypothetical protein